MVGPAELGVHGAEERGERLEQRNSGAGRKEELTRWGRLVSDVASGAGDHRLGGRGGAPLRAEARWRLGLCGALVDGGIRGGADGTQIEPGAILGRRD